MMEAPFVAIAAFVGHPESYFGAFVLSRVVGSEG
jgi:hypothetical protein